MPILFHDLNDFFNLLSMPFTISVGCIEMVNALRIMYDYDVCVLHSGHPFARCCSIHRDIDCGTIIP